MPDLTLRFSASGISTDLAIPSFVPPPPGDYSGARYQPRYGLPTGVTISPTTGLSVGYPVGMTGAADLGSANVVTLTDQGSISANRTALQNAIDATVSGAVGTETTIRLNTVSTNWGDEISIPAATWGGRGLTITGVSVPRATGVRIQSGDAASMPTFQLRPANAWSAPGYAGDPTFRTCIRIQELASNVQFVGLAFTCDSTHSQVQDPVLSSTSRLCGVGYIFTRGSDSTNFSDRITVDRCAFVGLVDRATHRGLYLNGTKITVVNSRFTDWHYRFGDSQAYLCGTGGAGHVVQNNYMSCAWGENILFGGVSDQYDGSGNPILANIQRDIVVRRNLLEFTPAYLAAGYLHKNLFESKAGQVALFEGNIGKGFRVDNGILGGQYFAFVFKYSNGACQQWCSRLNKVIDSNAGIFMCEGAADTEWMHNLFDRTGIADNVNSRAWTLQVSDVESPATFVRLPNGLTIRHNTFDENCYTNAGSAKQFQNWFYDLVSTSRNRTNWSIENNIGLQTDAVDNPSPTFHFTPGYYRTNDINTNANAAWSALMRPGSVVGDNVISGIITAQQDRKIGTDTVVQRKADVLLNAAFVPQAGSPALDKGCDITLLNAAIAGVTTGL